MALPISPENKQRLAVLVPLLALCISVFQVYPAWGRYGALKNEVHTKSIELERLKAAPVPEPGRLMPAAPALPTEPPQFLAHVNAMAREAGVQVAGFDLVGQAADKAEAVGTVKAVRAKIDLEGSYPAIRAFLAQVAATDRMYVVTDMDVTTSRSTTAAVAVRGPIRATLTIERYVTAVEAPGGAK